MKKLLYMGVTAAMILTIAGCGRTLKVEPAKGVTVEYGDKLDNNKLFDASKSDKDIKVSKVDGFDGMTVGSEKLKVTFTDKDDKGKIEKEITIDVKDTKAPVITLDKTEVNVDQNKDIELTKNIKSVKDPVDGDIKYNKDKVDKDGYFIDKGKLDTKKPGTYDINVIAFDKNANKAEKSFKVVVKKAEPKKEVSSNNGPSKNESPKQPVSNPQPQGTTSSPATASEPQAPAQPQQPACVSNGQFGRIGNSGQVFYNEQEADTWAWQQLDFGDGPWGQKGYNGYDAWTVTDNCGERNDVWTINFK